MRQALFFCPGLTTRARVCRMGAETETDGQGDAMKRKRYKLYDNYTTYFILLGLGFYYVLVIFSVIAFCVLRFVLGAFCAF